MTRTICRYNSVPLWLLCVFAPLSPLGLGQQSLARDGLPPLHTVTAPNFTIPFEVGSEETPSRTGAKSIREVELLVSKDRGRRWHSYARQPLESQKFAFHADSNGEYWFAFRTTTVSGNVSPMPGQPQLRVQVNTKEQVGALPKEPSESGPLTPPRPMRFRDLKETSPLHGQQVADLLQEQDVGQGMLALGNAPGNDDTPATRPPISAREEKEGKITNSGGPARTPIGPQFPGFEQSDGEKNREEDMLDALLSGMSSFLDVQPVVARTTSDLQVVAEKPMNTPIPPKSLSEIPAGGITGIVLNTTATKPQVVVQWNSGQEFWQDAQIDILRSSTKEGQRVPIAINLPNNGEYWWFLSPEDLKPFFLTVRIRSLHGGIHTDVTPSPIEIDSRLARFQ